MRGIRFIRQYYVHLLLLFIIIIILFVLHLLCFIMDFFVNTQKQVTKARTGSLIFLACEALVVIKGKVALSGSTIIYNTLANVLVEPSSFKI